MVDLPFSVPRIQSIEVKTRAEHDARALEKNGYITLHVCTPKCCHSNILSLQVNEGLFATCSIPAIPRLKVSLSLQQLQLLFCEIGKGDQSRVALGNANFSFVS